MKFQGAIFDFNGTVVWDMQFHDRAFDLFLEKHHVCLTNNEKRLMIHGKPNGDIMRGIFRKDLSDKEVDTMAQEKEAIYRSLCINELVLAPGVEDLFNRLKRNGIKMAIATSSGIENVNFYFEKLNIGQWFERENVVYDNGTLRGKPAPDMFVEATRLLKLTPQATVMFEDSKAGIVATERAGAGKTIIVNSYGEDYSEFSHDIITHFAQVDMRIFEFSD